MSRTKAPGFKALREHELAPLGDEDLIAHVIAAREAGDRGQVLLALQILTYGNMERVMGWVALKVPREDVEEVASQVLETAIAGAVRAPFEGEHIGEFRGWLKVISSRRIADYHRRRERRVDETSLPGEGDGDGHLELGASPDATDSVFVRELIDRALEELTEPHRLVVEQAGPTDMGFAGIPAKQAAAMVSDQLHLSADDSMTDVNVHQILSRFRARCRELFNEGSDSDD